MSLEQTLLEQIEESKRWLDRETEDSTYKREVQKRMELINWTLEKMKDSNLSIRALVDLK